jgi:proton-translocating NADH-quinone oxidoreductase chain L
VSDPLTLALIILALPLLASILSALCSAGFRRTASHLSDAVQLADQHVPQTFFQRYAHVPLVVACGTAAVLSALLLNKMLGAPEKTSYVSEPITWFAAGKLKATFTITVDALSAIMLGMISFIATFIALFSSGYMHGDKGYPRFFAVMGLFVFSMLGLVLANNFFLLILFWEGVGLCSYLLVGYYYEKPSAAAAARKAFLVTRIGDTGLILGTLLIWQLGGWHTNLNAVFEHIAKNPPDTAALTTACLLLFCGAVGKSAQFPLYVWLPDAMEGPTPVSALIHAATMVTAGVYLLARCAPLFVLCPDAQIAVSWIGGITALLAAFIALAQTDLKRVLAYSTVSQLGFMFLALGTGGAISPAFAVTAAMFHLFTHAFFKALLFLASGSVMHAMGGVIDVRQFGGLRKLLPVTHVTFLCGAAALAGLPLLSGFWSKDLILESLVEAGESKRPYSAGYFLLFVVACTTALMTAFYTFRAYLLTFWGPQRVPPEAGHHAHESPRSMTIPLMVLAVGAVFVGAALQPFTHWFGDFLGTAPSLAQADRVQGSRAVAHHLNWTMMGVSTALALFGVVLAVGIYGNGGAEKAPTGLEPVFAASRSKLLVDELYYALFVKPAEVLAFLARVFDGVLDGFTRVVASIPRFVAEAVRPIQNGLVQFYALSMALGLAVFLSFVVFKIAR